MQEKTLNKPLSGTEIKKAILHELEKQMDRDCRLAGHVAYSAYSFSAHVVVTFRDAGTANAKTAAEVHGGEGVFEEGEEVTTAEIEASSEEKTPNQVRVDSGQGVPVVAKGPGGRIEEKKVHYAPKKRVS